MIVVAIIGILAALALPKFSKFQAKARQAEVKSNLNHIYTLETAYQGDNETFIAFGVYGYVDGSTVTAGTACTAVTEAATLGFSLPDCSKVRYRYSVDAVSPGVIATSFTATGTTGTGGSNKVFPNCGTADTWTVNQDKSLQQTSGTGC
jgi:type II secretory pathway pseudopilin PulG